MKNEQDDWFDDLPPRKTLCEFFAQVGPPAGPPPAPEFEQPTPDRLGPLFDGPGRQPASPTPPTTSLDQRIAARMAGLQPEAEYRGVPTRPEK